MAVVKRTDLDAALSKVGRIVDKPSEGSIYQCVYCIGAAGALYLHTTNGSIWCSVSIDAEGLLDPFLVHWGTFRRFVSANKISSLTLEPCKGGILVRGEGCRAVLACPDARVFPSWPSSSPEGWAVLDGEDLCRMIERVIEHNGKKVTFPAMTGFHLEMKNGIVGITATDGRRLAHVETRVEQFQGETDVVVPESTLDLISRAKGPITLATNRFQLNASWDRISILSKLIDGKFPDWRSLTSIPLPREVSVDRAAMTAALKQLVDIDDYCGMRIEPGSAFLWAAGKHGQAGVRVPCRGEEKESLFLAPAQIMDFMSKMEGSEVALRWGLPQGPIRLVDSDRKGDINISMGCWPIPAPTEGIADA